MLISSSAVMIFTPAISVELALSSSMRIDLPSGMFGESSLRSVGPTDIYGSFEMLAKFRDA